MTIADVLLLCSKQEIAFHGHDESSSSLSKGNFLEILNLVAKHDKVIEDKWSLKCRIHFSYNSEHHFNYGKPCEKNL
jgi:hypothetical protein